MQRIKKESKFSANWIQLCRKGINLDSIKYTFVFTLKRQILIHGKLLKIANSLKEVLRKIRILMLYKFGQYCVEMKKSRRQKILFRNLIFYCFARFSSLS